MDEQLHSRHIRYILDNKRKDIIGEMLPSVR